MRVSERKALASNPSAADEDLLALAEDPDQDVRLLAAATAAQRPHLERHLARSLDRWVRAILAHSRMGGGEPLLPQTQRTLARDDFYEVRLRIAETTEIRELLEGFMRDPDPRVRGHCAANPSATYADIESILTDPDAAARALGVALAPLDSHQLDRAASDRSKRVRWEVAIHACGGPHLLRLREDPDETIRNHARGRRDAG